MLQKLFLETFLLASESCSVRNETLKVVVSPNAEICLNSR